MIYLSGVVRPNLRHPRLGWMVTPDMGNTVPSGDWWAMDNACFANPHGFDLDRFLAAAERRLEFAGDRCLFVVTPDVPFDADGTIRRFERWSERVRSLGAPVAFVTQDGMGAEDVPWAGIDAVFVGGSTEWKTGHESSAITGAARERGKWVHMGRVNSLSRLRAASSMGCDSADGTFLKYGPDVNEPRLLRWLESIEQERPMVLA